MNKNLIMEFNRYSVRKVIPACVIIVVLCCTYYNSNIWSLSDRTETNMVRNLVVLKNHSKGGTKSHDIQPYIMRHVERKNVDRKQFAAGDTGVFRYRDVESSKIVSTYLCI